MSVVTVSTRDTNHNTFSDLMRHLKGSKFTFFNLSNRWHSQLRAEWIRLGRSRMSSSKGGPRESRCVWHAGWLSLSTPTMENHHCIRRWPSTGEKVREQWQQLIVSIPGYVWGPGMNPSNCGFNFLLEHLHLKVDPKRTHRFVYMTSFPVLIPQILLLVVRIVYLYCKWR